jgi:hypothetical protein
MVKGGGETMKLGAFFHPTGNHVAAWLHPDAQIDAGTNFRHYAEITQTAERGKFDLMFVADAVATRPYRHPISPMQRKHQRERVPGASVWWLGAVRQSRSGQVLRAPSLRSLRSSGRACRDESETGEDHNRPKLQRIDSQHASTGSGVRPCCG